MDDASQVYDAYWERLVALRDEFAGMGGSIACVLLMPDKMNRSQRMGVLYGTNSIIEAVGMFEHGADAAQCDLYGDDGEPPVAS